MPAGGFIRPRTGLLNDKLLEDIVSLVNRRRMEFEITLTVAAGIISGTIVNREDYLRNFYRALISNQPTETVDEIQKIVGPIGVEWQKDDSTEENSTDFIHLRDARFLQFGSPYVSIETGLWWRGKLRDVVGFSLGQPLTSLADQQHAPIGYLLPDD
jgi:hypothetical protein